MCSSLCKEYDPIFLICCCGPFSDDGYGHDNDDDGADGDTEDDDSTQEAPYERPAAPATVTKIVMDPGEFWDDALPSSRTVRKNIMGRRVRKVSAGGGCERRGVGTGGWWLSC